MAEVGGTTSSSAIVLANKLNEEKPAIMAAATPLTSSFDDHIRPLLDAVDRLRQLKVMKEGIELPTIVVVGDQSSGKSSVLESLAGIALPRGQGICTRVPLIMRLQNQTVAKEGDQPPEELILEYLDKRKPTTEYDITDAIRAATDEIAGYGKGISNIPLTLVVRKPDVPDLTMVDLPGITRVPVHGQPEDIYEQISGIIMEYISPKESIILNVLSATVDFPTCESIRMSQRVDKTGQRTLAVVTKADKHPEGLLEKVNADDVNIGLGYVCVRNRIGDETYEEARAAEAALFLTHPLLRRIDKSIATVPVLAQRLMQIQAASIARCLPDIVRKIDDKLNQNLGELDKLPKDLTTAADAIKAFMHFLGVSKDILKKILIRGEFEEFHDDDDDDMHGTARLAEMLHDYAKELSLLPVTSSSNKFLLTEIEILEEYKMIGLAGFLPLAVFMDLLRSKIRTIAHIPHEFVDKVWGYVEGVATRITSRYSDAYPQLQVSSRRAVHAIMERMRRRSAEHIKELVRMELLVSYTSNPDYVKTLNSLMEQQGTFMAAVQSCSKPAKMNLKPFGEVDVGHLRGNTAMAGQAFDMTMRLNAYWQSVILRLVDGLALHVVADVHRLVEQELEVEMMTELVGAGANGMERMLQENPATASKRERLKDIVQLLRESKDIVAGIMDRIVT